MAAKWLQNKLNFVTKNIWISGRSVVVKWMMSSETYDSKFCIEIGREDGGGVYKLLNLKSLKGIK